MHSKIVRAFQQLIDVGIQSSTSASLARRIRQSNFIAVLISSCAFVLAIPYALSGLFAQALGGVAFTLVYLATLLLNKIGRTFLSRFILILALSFGAVVSCVAYGREAGGQFSFLLLVTVPFLIFDSHEKKATLFGVLAAVVPYSALEATGYTLGLSLQPMAPPSFLHDVNIGLVFTLLLAKAAYSRFVYSEADRKLTSSLSQLKQTHFRNQALLSAIPDGILRVRKDGVVVDCHRIDSTPLGLEAKRVIGRRLEEIPTPTLLDAGFKQAIAFAKSPRPESLEFQLHLASSSSNEDNAKFFEVRCVRAGEDEVIIIMRNRTEAIRAEETIKQQRAMMINNFKMSALGEMTSTIGHEINNPLMVIRGNSDIIKRVVEKSNDQAQRDLSKSAQKIAQMTDKIAKIVRSIRTMARNGEQDSVEPVPLERVINEAVELCRERLRAHGIQLRIQAFPPDLIVNCRLVQIGQILVNLLNNAHDAIGEVVFEEGSPAPLRWVEVSAVRQGDWIEIRVRDSGPGVSAEARAHLFEPFFTTKKSGRGSGLGLSVSKGIAEAHGGTLRLDNTESQTTFILTLPLSSSSSSQASVLKATL